MASPLVLIDAVILSDPPLTRLDAGQEDLPNLGKRSKMEKASFPERISG